MYLHGSDAGLGGREVGDDGAESLSGHFDCFRGSRGTSYWRRLEKEGGQDGYVKERWRWRKVAMITI